MDVGRWVVVGWMYGWMCRKVVGGWVDVWEDVSVGDGGRVDVWMDVSVGVVVGWNCGWLSVGGWLDVWMDLSVVGLWLGGYLDECVLRCVVFGWICR